MNQESIATTEIKQLKDFKVFPKHVGLWQGDWLRLDANGQEVSRLTATVSKRIIDNQWIQTNNYNYADGSTAIDNFVGNVIGEGIVDIISTNPSSPFKNFKSVAEEHGDNLILFNVWDKGTGALIAIETITLVRHDYCVRTTQSFSPDGTIKNFSIITEHKVDS